jgi:DNA-binding HxlR family transcriptional regulator
MLNGHMGTTEHATVGDSAYCPVFQHTVEVIGRRWSGAIIRALLSGSVRFGDILQRVPHLSDRLLSERLRELEAEGIVTRSVFPEVPVRIEYRLTDAGRELESIVGAIDAWAARWGHDPAEAGEAECPGAERAS